MYKPLPDGITIKKSPINGLGLFATETISENTLLGIIHIPIRGEKNGYFRTPLGGFGNHSDDPNCTKLRMEDGSWWIATNKDIMAGDELTWKYSLYKISEIT